MPDPLTTGAGGCPPRPSTLDAADLGFRPRAMVRWLDPHQLLDTARRVVVSGMFGSYTDQREVQALVPSTVPDLSGTAELWFDYVADVGDGWNSTYTVARLLAQEQLTLEWGGESQLTERGRVLVMGGDQVYPVPTREGYENRLLGPYRAAMPCACGPSPELFAIPGSHDWYDGLINFTSVFCRGRRIGAWKTSQSRSYFALKLPHRWWLWAIDIQFGSYLDEGQLTYFSDVATSDVRPGDRIILCLAKEVDSGRDEAEMCSDRTADYLEREIVGPAGAEVVLCLKSGRHHYCRYEQGSGRRQQIRAGGGGAFLHPTNHLPEHLDLPGAAGPTRHRRAAAYPSPAASKRLRKRVWLLPFYNLPLVAFFGAVYVVVALMLGLHIEKRYTGLGVSDLWHQLWASPLLALLILMAAGVLAAMVRFAHDAPRFSTRLVMGVVHFSLQLVTMAVVMVTASRLSTGRPGAGAATAFFALVGLLGGLASGFGLSGYLWVANCLGLHDNEAYAPLHHMDYKNFLRLHIDDGGALTVFPVAVDRVVRRWRACPEAPPQAPWFAPDGPEPEVHLIEAPIRFEGTSRRPPPTRNPAGL